MRGFEESGLILDCAVESTPRMAEQLALEKMFIMSAVADRHERTFGARAPSMDLMCHNVLAGTALAGEENRRVARGCALCRLQQSLHHGIVRFEQGNEIISGARHQTIRIFACFVHGRPLTQKSVTAFKPDNVDAETFTAAQQIGINSTPK